MHVEVDRLVDPQLRAELAAGLERVLADVRAAVQRLAPDARPAARSHRRAGAAAAGACRRRVAAESRAFLQWLADDHLTLLGYRRHDLAREQGEDLLRLVPGSGLGVLREVGARGLGQLRRRAAAGPGHGPRAAAAAAGDALQHPLHRAPAGLQRLRRRQALQRRRRGGRRAPLHRPVQLHRLQRARRRDPAAAPARWRRCTQRAALPQGGHLAKALQHILATYPRDDLFQIGEDELYDTALGILSAGERQRLRLFLWRDPYERFVSCLVYVPREAYSTELRKKFQAILMDAFAGQRADFGVLLGDTLLARVHFTIRTPPGQVPAYDRARDRSRLAAAARRWDDELRDALVDEAGEGRGMALFKRWGAAFPQVYREVHRARAAVPDVLKIDALTPEQPLGAGAVPAAGRQRRTAWASRSTAAARRWCCRTACRCSSTWACACMGEDNFRIRQGHGDGALVSMHDFELDAPVADELEPEALARLFEDAFAQVFRGEVENDDFNRLVLRAGLAADEIVVLRAYAKYLQADRLRAVAGHASRRRWRRSRTSRACWSSCSTCASHPEPSTTTRRPAAQVQRHRAGAGPRQQPQRGPRAAPAAGADPGHAAHQLLAHRRRPQRRAGPRRSFLSFKLDSAKVPGLPEPAAAVRDLRLLAALRGHPPARRQGRARRPALVATGRRTSAPRCWAW